jgi:hypothetical protein
LKCNLFLKKEIYTNYISIIARYSIDCPKNERLKMHKLFAELDSVNRIGKITAASVFQSVYEDTFDSIEEFLLLALYDEWKAFMETEDSYFNHVCIYFLYNYYFNLIKPLHLCFALFNHFSFVKNIINSIERSIRIRSKKLDELIKQGLVKIVGQKKSIAEIFSYVMLISNLGLYKLKSPFDKSVSLENNSDYSVKELAKQLNEKSNQIQADKTTETEKKSLQDLVNNPKEFKYFKDFLESHKALQDIMFWMDLENYEYLLLKIVQFNCL